MEKVTSNVNFITKIGEIILGKKLVKYYEEVEKKGGEKAKFRLGLLTCVPLVFARILEDTPERIEMFENAVREIMKDYKNGKKP